MLEAQGPNWQVNVNRSLVKLMLLRNRVIRLGRMIRIRKFKVKGRITDETWNDPIRSKENEAHIIRRDNQ